MPEEYLSSENIYLIFSYISTDDDARLKRMIQDINPQDVHGIFMPGTDLTMLHCASLKGSLVIQNWLIDNMAFPPDLDSNTEIWTPAHVAAIGGKDVCLEALLMRKPEVINRPDRRLLSLHIDKLINLVRGCTPTHLAAAHGRLHCLKLILKNTRFPPNINMKCSKSNWTPLMYATWHGRISCVELLIRHGATTDTIDMEGRTPLHLCASEGHLPLVKYFLEEGCHDINACLSAVDNYGFTALKLAEMHMKYDVCEFLKNKKSDPKFLEYMDDLRFPGHIAALNGNLTKIKTLIEKGYISVNDTDQRGYTMLHKAALGGHLPILEWLLCQGASVWVKTLGNETCRDIAERKKNFKILEFLKQEEIRYVPEKERNILIPLFSSLDGTDTISMEPQRFNEIEKEAKSQIVILEEQIKEYESVLSRLVSKESKEVPAVENQEECDNNKLKIKSINYKILKLNFKLTIAKFNLYQLTREPTPKELEIGNALAECEHQHEEISDQLLYERTNREQLEIELTRVRTLFLKLRGCILKDDPSNELVTMIISFDRFLTETEKSHLVIDDSFFNKNKKFSIHFEINSLNKITISKVTYYLKDKKMVETNIENISLKEFIKYVKLIIKIDQQYIKNKKKVRLNRKKNISPKGGIFVTTK